MTNRTLPFVLLLAVPGFVACTSAADSSSQAEIGDSAGLKIVYSPTPEWVQSQAWTVQTEPRLVIGGLSGPEEYQLADVVAAGRRSDESLVVVDRGSQTVRLYDPEGSFLRTFGGPGSGPGEFIDPGSLLVTAGDTVVVWDQALLRVTRFDPEGVLVGAKTLDWSEIATGLDMVTMPKGGNTGTKGKGAGSGLFPGLIEPLENGELLVRLVEKTGNAPPPGFHRPPSGALLVSEDLSVIDVFMFFGDTEKVSVDAPWGRFSVDPPLAKRTRITHQGNPPKICVGDQEEAEIVCFGPDGERTALRWVPEPVPLTEAEVAAWREAAVRMLEIKLSRDQVLGMLDKVPIRRYRPPYSQIILDRAGNLWAERGPSPGSPKPSIDFLVFDPQGVLLGVVTLPPIQVLEIGLDYVLGLYRDALDIQYVHVHDLRKHSAETQ